MEAECKSYVGVGIEAGGQKASGEPVSVIRGQAWEPELQVVVESGEENALEVYLRDSAQST